MHGKDEEHKLAGCAARRKEIISIIIPARNEEHHIGAALYAIHNVLAGRQLYEVILVDNESIDGTAEVARRLGAKVISRTGQSIGALRNAGVSVSRGTMVVFLDADVVIREDWGNRIVEVLRELQEDPHAIWGSICDIPDDAGWVERFWFNPRFTGRTSHIGSGHMILARSLFDELGGFDEALVTGEDYDLSQRARRRGARLVLDPRLRAEHRGYPSRISTFFVREIWHGRADFRSWRSFVESKVAIASSVFALLHVILLGSMIVGSGIGVIATLGLLFSLCLGATLWRFPNAPWEIRLVNVGLTYVYFLGRAISAVVSMRAPRAGRPRDVGGARL